MIRVLIVDDSAVVRALLKDVLEADPEIRVVGEAENGKVGVEMAEALRPGLITMDVRMPVMDGLEAVSEIMAKVATPILVVTASLDREETNLGFRAIQLGALDVMMKPRAYSRDEFQAIGRDLLGRVKMLARVHVIPRPRPSRRKTRRLAPSRLSQRRRVVAIGASLGGPNAVAQVLQGLPPNFPAPILLVQHIAPGFTEGYADWLGRESPLPVAVAREGDVVTPGRVLVAPNHAHMAVVGNVVRLVDGAPINSCKPAIDVLFESLAREAGEDLISVLLTGMGSDGAEGSRHVKTCRGYTIAQDKETCIVWGMPKVAIDLGVIDSVLPVGKIGAELTKLVAPAPR